MIQTEPTPNPDSLKFISEKVISSVGTEEFQKSKINEISNIFIKALLGFKGVELILLSKNLKDFDQGTLTLAKMSKIFYEHISALEVQKNNQ